MNLRSGWRIGCLGAALFSFGLVVDGGTRFGVSIGYPLGDWGYVGYGIDRWHGGPDYWHGPSVGLRHGWGRHHGWDRHHGWYDPWWGWSASARWRYEPVTIVEVEPAPPPTPVERAWQEFSAGQVETAAARFAAVEADPESTVGEAASAEFGAGLAELASGDLGPAVARLRSAVAREPGLLRETTPRGLRPRLESLKQTLVYGWPAGLTLDDAQFLRAVLFAATGDPASARHVAQTSLGQSAEWAALRAL